MGLAWVPTDPGTWLKTWHYFAFTIAFLVTNELGIYKSLFFLTLTIKYTYQNMLAYLCKYTYH